MRNIFIALSFCLLFVSCEKENLVEQKIQNIGDLSDMQKVSFNDGVFEIRPGGFIEFEALYSGRLYSLWKNTYYYGHDLFVGYFEDSQEVYYFEEYTGNDWFEENVVIDVRKGMKIRIENFSGSEESILLYDIVIKGEAVKEEVKEEVKEDKQEDSNFDF